jgi:hypothetical protein
MRTPLIAAATAITLAALSLCACTTFSRADDDAGSDTQTATQEAGAFGPVSAVTVTFGEQAQQLAATDTRLTPDAVAVAVEHELQRHHLYAPASPSVHRSLAITVENFTNELATNTRILGFTYRNVMLNGMVQVQGAAAQPPFDVHARVRITSHTTTAEGPSLAQLYTRFAVVTVAALRGVEPPAP